MPVSSKSRKRIHQDPTIAYAFFASILGVVAIALYIGYSVGTRAAGTAVPASVALKIESQTASPSPGFNVIPLINGAVNEVKKASYKFTAVSSSVSINRIAIQTASHNGISPFSASDVQMISLRSANGTILGSSKPAAGSAYTEVALNQPFILATSSSAVIDVYVAFYSVKPSSLCSDAATCPRSGNHSIQKIANGLTSGVWGADFAALPNVLAYDRNTGQKITSMSLTETALNSYPVSVLRQSYPTISTVAANAKIQNGTSMDLLRFNIGAYGDGISFKTLTFQINTSAGVSLRDFKIMRASSTMPSADYSWFVNGAPASSSTVIGPGAMFTRLTLVLKNEQYILKGKAVTYALRATPSGSTGATSWISSNLMMYEAKASITGCLMTNSVGLPGISVYGQVANAHLYGMFWSDNSEGAYHNQSTCSNGGSKDFASDSWIVPNELSVSNKLNG